MFGSAWEWPPGRAKGAYVPGDVVQGGRHEWPAEPYMCKPVACYLCGEDFDTKQELHKHWHSRRHLTLPDAGAQLSLTTHRVEEEMRKRLFYHETFDGPFEVRGQEMRRTVGAHAFHQTHSNPGTGSLNYSVPYAP